MAAWRSVHGDRAAPLSAVPAAAMLAANRTCCLLFLVLLQALPTLRAQEFVALPLGSTTCEENGYLEVESTEDCEAAATLLGQAPAWPCPDSGCQDCGLSALGVCTLLPRGCLTQVSALQVTSYHYNGQGALGGLCGVGQWSCVCKKRSMADQIKFRSPGCTMLDLDVFSSFGLDRGVCSDNSYGSTCTAYVHSESEQLLTCSQWCGQHGRSALTSGWTCGAAFESEADGNYIFPRGYPCSNNRRLTTGIPGHLDNILEYPWQANIKECCQKQEIECGDPSPVGRLLCECNTDASEDLVLQDEGARILSEFLRANPAPKHGDKLEVEFENHRLGAYALSCAGIISVGGTVTIEIGGTRAAVRVPASVLQLFTGCVGILLVGAHAAGRDESSNLLDDQDQVVPLLGSPLNVRFANILGDFVPLRDLQDPIGVRLPTQNVPRISWSCAWWEGSSRRWTTEDVDFVGNGDGYIWCETTHLTLFAALGRALLEALICSNAQLLSEEGVSMITKGSWFYEPGAIFLWIVCLLHVGLCARAVRFDRRSRREALWDDRYFLSLEDGKKSQKTGTQGDSRDKPTFRSWLRVELIVFCVQELVSHALWISTRDMPALIDCADNEEGDDIGDAEAREGTGSSLPARSRYPASSEGDTPAAVDGTARGEAVEPAASTEIPQGEDAKSKPILTTSSFFGTGFRPDLFKSRTLPGVERNRTTAAAVPPAQEEPPPKDAVPPEQEEPPPKDDPPPEKNKSANFRLLLRGVLRTRPLEDAAWRQPEAARCLAKPIKRELEKSHQHVSDTTYPRCYISWIIFFGAIPWPYVYRYSIFESATTRALHLSAEVAGAMLFAAFFFGIDAPAVNSPESCEAEGWEEQLWDELAAGFLSFWFALIPVLILRLLSMRSFKVMSSEEEINRQLLQWRIRDGLMWALGVAYIAFAIFFIITFLASTKPGSGASFAVSSVLEELCLYVMVPLSTVLAYSLLDCLFQKEEKDYEQAKGKLRLERKKFQDIRRRSTASI